MGWGKDGAWLGTVVGAGVRVQGSERKALVMTPSHASCGGKPPPPPRMNCLSLWLLGIFMKSALM